MQIRKTETDDVRSILELYGQAQQLLKNNGVDQWQEGYPNAEVLQSDMEARQSFVVEIAGEIAATYALSAVEDSYDHIYDGNWGKQGRFFVVHRMTVGEKYRGLGLASCIFEHIKQYCATAGVRYVRVDTHKDNQLMQGQFRRWGFVYRGKIKLSTGAERLAFDLNF